MTPDPLDGSDLASALKLQAESLLAHVRRLIDAERISEVSVPALEAIEVYRQAAAAGAEVTGIARNLVTLSSWMAKAGLATEAVSASQAAVDVLRPFQPSEPDRVSYLSLLAEGLHTLVVRLISAERISEVSAPALEAIEVYRKAADAGAEVTGGEGIANILITLSSRLARVGLTAEADAAADASGRLLTINGYHTTTATIAGSPTPVELPAALVNVTNHISLDPSTGWPPQHPPTSTIIDVRPSPVSFTFADWRHSLTIALANTEVKKLVGDAFDWLGCHLLGLRNAESPLQVLVCLRNSVTGRLVDVRISGNMVTAVDTREPWEHPESPAEMARAIELVRSNPEHAQHITGLEAHAILRVPNDTKSSSYGHRCMHVMFTEPDDPHIEREVCYAAMVDLETQTVVAARKMPCSHNNT